MPRSQWERWTIDEIADGLVRLLMARAGEAAPLDRLEAARPAGEDAATDAETVVDTRRAVMDLELSIDDQDDWGDESSIVLELDALVAFLGRYRPGKPGLPTRRPLREGDVFMVQLPPGAGGLEALVHGPAGQGGIPEALAAYEGPGADVWDVTAAARQCAKRSYHGAVQAGAPEPDRG